MEPEARNQHKILVVEDDRDARELAAEVVAYVGCVPLQARSAAKAVDVLEDEKVDLMLLDLHMPGATGMDLLKALHKRRLTLPTVVVSGYISPTIANQLVGLGVAAIVAKPFRMERLIREIKRILQIRDEDVPERTRRCPSCARLVAITHNFCSECGHPLNADSSAGNQGTADVGTDPTSVRLSTERNAGMAFSAPLRHRREGSGGWRPPWLSPVSPAQGPHGRLSPWATTTCRR